MTENVSISPPRHYLQGMDMGLCDYDGRTALHLAAAEGHQQCVTFLLDICKVEVEAADRLYSNYVSFPDPKCVLGGDTPP